MKGRDVSRLPFRPGTIEVGAVGGDLRYWLAKESVRQGEIRLTAQNGIRTALEARATALTGWAAIGFLTTVGAAFAAKTFSALSGAIMAATVLFIAGGLGIVAARPRSWSLVGYEPDSINELAADIDTELGMLESMNGGLAAGVAVNNRRIADMATMLRWAGWLLVLAPAAGGTAYVAAFLVSRLLNFQHAF